MTWKNDGVIGKAGKGRETVVHVFYVAVGKVGASAAIEKECVTRDKRSSYKKALTTWCVSRSVHHGDVETAHADNVSWVVRGEICGRYASHFDNRINFGLLHMDRNIDAFEQRGDAFNVEAHH